MTPSPIPPASVRTALITGANRGMGLGYVRHYLREGWAVVAATRVPAEAAELRAGAQAHQDRLLVLPLDLESEASIDSLKAELVARDIRVDLLINNAGISPSEGFEDWSAEPFLSGWRVNVMGPALLVQEIVPLMPRGSKLINISSGMGSLNLNIAPDGPLDVYAMSKAALNMLTRRLATKLQPAGITVVSVNPGWVQTRMGGSGAPTTIEQAVSEITRTIHDLQATQSGSFLAADGEQIPW